MRTTILRLPHLHFVYITIVLAALLCICLLVAEMNSLQQELEHMQDQADQLQDELSKIKRYSEHYGTTPQVIASVFRESEKYGLNPAIMLELIKTESNYKPEAISGDGAKGLCQIRPVTAKATARELGLVYQAELLHDTEYSIKLGTYHLAKLVSLYKDDYHSALTAYNRGIKGLEKYVQRTGTPVSTYSSRINEGSLALAN